MSNSASIITQNYSVCDSKCVKTGSSTSQTEIKTEQQIPLQLFPKKPSINQSGERIKLASNYFAFSFTDTSKSCFFKYNVDFSPEIPGDSVALRRRIFGKIGKEIGERFGNFLFHNTVFFATENINEPEMKYKVKMDDQEYEVIIKWANYVEANSVESLPLFKRFFYNLLTKMNYIQFKKSYFDKGALKKVQDIEIWPGFDPSINLYQDKILLNLNTLSKIIRPQNALDFLNNLSRNFKSSQADFQEKANEAFKGMSALTRYNNDKTFTITSVDFTLNPKSTFETKKGPISYVDYYKEKYKKNIRELTQPLLVSTDKKTKKTIHFIPEFCYLTGLTDEMRSNFNFMKQVSQYTIGQANSKMNECINLVKNIIKNVECNKDIKKWGISISQNPVCLEGRKLNPGCMQMKNKNSFPIEGSNDIDRKVQAEMFSTPKIYNWIIFYSRNNKQLIERTFINTFLQCIQTFKFEINKPKLCEVNSTRYPDWEREIKNNVNKDTQFVFLVIPGNRGKGFFYNEVKSFFTHEVGIPCQVMLEGTLKKDRGLRSVINKILIQICAKIGGEPWVIDQIPCKSKPTMLMSFCVYKNIIVSCGTYNRNFSKYNSKVVEFPEPSQIKEKICNLFKFQVEQFKKKTGVDPENIIIFRDGITPSLKKMVIDEIKAINETIKEINPKIQFSYIQINKKHNLKVVIEKSGNNYENIPSGTLIDNAVVGNDYEFYLVSQKSNQGISQATQYKIIFDGIGLKPEDIHLLVYKTCFLYYNWVGGIKTPAPAHYAKKLAFLIGDKMSNRGNVTLPNEKIGALYFL